MSVAKDCAPDPLLIWKPPLKNPGCTPDTHTLCMYCGLLELQLSIDALVYTIVPPGISPEVMDQTQNETDTASFTCQATGEPVPTISWYFNDIPVVVTNTTKYTVSVTSLNVTTNSSVLTIMSIQSSDVGTYTCNATNVVSSDTSSGVLTVNGENYFII